MVEIDGSRGEGGGQILRSSLTLAVLTGQSVQFTGIRANRPKPGLMRQHLACAQAVAQISNGSLQNAELNATEMTFIPGKIRGGDFRFTVGSAGSVTLIAQTVLPCLIHAGTMSTVVIEGGTHVPFAPTFDFFDLVYLPMLRRLGADVTATLERCGFYPAGGGRITLTVRPTAESHRLELVERGDLQAAELTAGGSHINPKICEDELNICLRALQLSLPVTSRSLTVDSPGPGNVLQLLLRSQNTTELLSICGEMRLSRQAVGEKLAKAANEYQALGVPVWRYLADQLLLPLAVTQGGVFLTCPPSEHTRTNSEVIRRFTDVKIIIQQQTNGKYIIEVKK